MALGTIGTAIATGAAGSLASKAFGGGNKTSTTAPWGPAAGRLEDVLNRTQDLFESGRVHVEPYSGRRVADFSPQTIAALGAAERGTGMFDPARQNLTDMMQGRSISGQDFAVEDNTYRDFDRIRQNVGDQVKARLNSTFAGGGVNSSLAQDTYTRALGDALANVEYGAYNDAQDRRLKQRMAQQDYRLAWTDRGLAGDAQRLSAIGMAPSIAGIQRDDTRMALGAGTMRDDLAQRRIDADMAKYYENEDKDMRALRDYAGIAMGAAGLGSTTTTPTSFWNETLPGMGKFASGIGGMMEAYNSAPEGSDFWGSLFGGGE